MKDVSYVQRENQTSILLCFEPFPFCSGFYVGVFFLAPHTRPHVPRSFFPCTPHTSHVPNTPRKFAMSWQTPMHDTNGTDGTDGTDGSAAAAPPCRVPEGFRCHNVAHLFVVVAGKINDGRIRDEGYHDMLVSFDAAYERERKNLNGDDRKLMDDIRAWIAATRTARGGPVPNDIVSVSCLRVLSLLCTVFDIRGMVVATCSRPAAHGVGSSCRHCSVTPVGPSGDVLKPNVLLWNKMFILPPCMP